MKHFQTKQVFYGRTHAALVNNTLGTHFHDYDRSLVDLQQFGSEGIQAWFVHMNGQTHGWARTWLWKNYLSDDETTIKEYYAIDSKQIYINRRDETGYFPFRLAFQLNPYDSNPYPATNLKENCHCCQFKGVFRLVRFLEEDLSAMEYEKVSDTFCLGDDEQYNPNVTQLEDLCNSPLYRAPIEKARLSPQTIRMLKNGGIRYVWELLTLDVSELPSLKKEVHAALYQHFSN